MWQSLKKNPALATGILLPVMLVFLFAVAALLPKLLVEPPAHDLLFGIKNYSPQRTHEYQFAIDKDRLVFQARKLPTSAGQGGYHYTLYRYEAATSHVHQVALPDTPVNSTRWTAIPLKETRHWKITPELAAPDGYKLHSDYRHTSDLGLIFFSGRQRSAIHIIKDGRIVSIFPPPEERAAYTPEFIGWIVETEAES